MTHRDQSTRRATLSLRILCVAFAAAALAAALTWRATPAPAASAVTVGGPFTLTAPDGATVTDATYRGRWLLVYFGFTFCPDTCPMALFEIAAALAKLGPDAEQVQALFITVDPQRDTPAVMGDYAQSFDARIVGLTGTPQQIAAVAEEYGVPYAAHRPVRPDDYVMDHGTYVYLMDRDGKFVRGFDAEATGDHIAEALRKVIARSRAQVH